jgi:hypothetical protein
MKFSRTRCRYVELRTCVPPVTMAATLHSTPVWLSIIGDPGICPYPNELTRQSYAICLLFRLSSRGDLLLRLPSPSLFPYLSRKHEAAYAFLSSAVERSLYLLLLLFLWSLLPLGRALSNHQNLSSPKPAKPRANQGDLPCPISFIPSAILDIEQEKKTPLAHAGVSFLKEEP